MVGSISQMGNVSRTSAVQNDDQKKLNELNVRRSSTNSSSGDKLEISAEALRLRAESSNGSGAVVRNSEAETKRIRDNIASGFYNSPSVQRAVAMKINGNFPTSDSQ